MQKRLEIDEITKINLGLADAGFNLIVFENDLGRQDFWVYMRNNMYNPDDHKYDNEIVGKNVNFLIEQEYFFKDRESIITKLDELPVMEAHYSFNWHVIRFRQ